MSGELSGEGRNGVLDPRLSFMVFVGEDAEEEPEEPGVVDPEHDPSHLDNQPCEVEILGIH